LGRVVGGSGVVVVGGGVVGFLILLLPVWSLVCTVLGLLVLIRYLVPGAEVVVLVVPLVGLCGLLWFLKFVCFLS
jgi:hypothetical protein